MLGEPELRNQLVNDENCGSFMRSVRGWQSIAHLRCVPQPGMRLLSVFAEASIAARREWYRRLGHAVVEESAEYLNDRGRVSV